MIDNPLFANAIKKATQMIDAGMCVKSINFFMKKDPGESGLSSAAVRSNVDDPKFWEDNCHPLELYNGVYNGYRFLYVESQFYVETDEVTPGDINASLMHPSIGERC